MKSLPIAAFLLAGCTATPSARPPSSPASGLALPEPMGALEFAPGSGEIALDALLRQFAVLTGQELVMDVQTQLALENTKEPLESEAPVPAAEVYAFVEGILARQGFFVLPLKGGSRPLLGIYTARSPGGMPHSPLVVDLAQLDELEDHPALLVRVTVQFENVDARQLQTQLRQLLVDASGTRTFIPAGEHSLILQGMGRDTAGLVRLLMDVDAASAGRARPVLVSQPSADKR